MPQTAAEEQCKQILRTFEGMEDRLKERLDELSPEQREIWRERFHTEANNLARITEPVEA